MSQLTSIEDLKDLSGYKKDLKKSLDNVQASPAKLFYAQSFEFKGRKGPLVLVGELPSGLSKGLKEAKVPLKLGKCRRNDNQQLEVFRGLPPDKIALAFKFAGIDESIAEKEIEGGAEGQETQTLPPGVEDSGTPALSGAMQKKMQFETAQFEKGKYGEREKDLLAQIQSTASTHKDDPAFAQFVKEAKSDILKAREAVAKGDFQTANGILDQTAAQLTPLPVDSRMEKKLGFETDKFNARADAAYKAREKDVLAQVQQFASDNKDNPEALKGIRDIKEQILNARGLASGKEFDKANAILNRMETAIRVTGPPPKTRTQEAAKQENLKTAVNAELEYLKGADVRFQQGLARELKKLPGGKEFKDFVGKLEKFESTMNISDRDALEKSANAYLVHYEKDLSTKKQQDSAAKKQKVEQTLKNIKLLKLKDEAATADLGPPPWPRNKQDKVMELHAQILVADGRAAKLKDTEKGNSDSFFLNDMKGKPAYIFKPQVGESRPMLKRNGVPTDDPDPNWPEGGGAPREKVFSDFNASMKEMGLDFGIASAVVVEMESDAFTTGKVSQDKKRTGVIQEAIPNDGNAKNYVLGGISGSVTEELSTGKLTPDMMEARKRSVNTEDLQKIALLDFITLNGDRNADNILLQGKSDQPGATRLRPIDAGNALPSRKAFEANAATMYALPTQKGKPIDEGNALMQLPQSLEPFSPEMMKQIEGMDPKKVADSLRKSNSSLQGDMAGKIGEETFQMVERSVAFLKLACKVTPAPSVSEIADVYATGFVQVLDAKEDQLPALVTNLMHEAQKRSATILSELKAAELEEEQNEKDFKQLGGLSELKRLGGVDQGTIKGNLNDLRRLGAAEQEYIGLGGEAEYRKLGGLLVAGKESKTIAHLRDDLKRLKAK